MDSPTSSIRQVDWFRAANALLGCWLIASAFLWPHTQAQRANATIVGGLVVVFAAISTRLDPRARYVNTALAVWLFVCAFALPSFSLRSIWNDLFVAILMLAYSLIPTSAPRRTRGHIP